MVKNNIKTYSELITLQSFEDRVKYLQLNSNVGFDTFGFERYINQKFYKSLEWNAIRESVIIRDNCCDLALEGHDVFGKIIVHHMNPISVDDIKLSTDYLLNPEYLITTTLKTHNLIHYGGDYVDPMVVVTRERNDTCPWKK